MIEKPLDESYLRSHPLPKHSGGDKHSRGRVLVIAGNVELPGAAILAGQGALRAGAGVLRIAVCQTNAPHIGAVMPEAMVVRCSEDAQGEIGIENGPRLVELAKDSDSVLIGPGMVDESSIGRLCALLFNEAIGPIFVVDAAAFTSLRHFEVRKEQRGGLVCTPHFGEMAKFLGREREEIERHALRSATEAARSVHAVVALKGASTHIVGLSDEALLNEQGTVGLATSGSGDTLAGIVAGLAARGTSPFLAAAWGVYLHAVAGRLVADRVGSLGLLARELPEEIPRSCRTWKIESEEKPA